MIPGKSCENCPNGAICKGGWNMYPESFYWRSSELSDNFIKCILEDACLKGDENNKNGQCNDGYKGNLCNLCISGYSKGFDLAC